LVGRRGAPDSLPQCSGFRLRAFQLAEACERRPRRHTRQTFAHKHYVGAHTVFTQDVGETALVRIDLVALRFEAHPPVQHEIGQLVARDPGKRRGGIEPAADLRSVDAQQPHTPNCDDVDGVAVDDGSHQHGIRSPYRRRGGRRGRQPHGKNCQPGGDGNDQKLHRDLLWHAPGEAEDPHCKSSATRASSSLVLRLAPDDGIVREPAAPFFSHQHVVLKIARLLADYVEGAGLGQIGVAPLDVILDADRSLIVQPDLLFVSAARTSIIRNQVWGAPDLVGEVLSPGSAMHDRTDKVDWYRQHGVRECWIVDPAAEQITVFDFGGAAPESRTIDRTGTVQSATLPYFSAPAQSLLP
jgi:Uma2 family endonuclease